MKLRGTEPAESIDLSRKGLTVLSATVIASLIGSNTATKSLKYVAARSTRFLRCQQPLTVLSFLSFLLRSLASNQLCGLDMHGLSTYRAEGITAITEMLKVNTTLQSIRCASLAHFLAHCQQPLTVPFASRLQPR